LHSEQIFVPNLFCESLLECKIYFARVYWSAKFILQEFIGVQNLFCESLLECKIYFAEAKFYFAALWSAKFICRSEILFCGPLECKIYFAALWSAKFILQKRNWSAK